MQAIINKANSAKTWVAKKSPAHYTNAHLNELQQQYEWQNMSMKMSYIENTRSMQCEWNEEDKKELWWSEPASEKP